MIQPGKVLSYGDIAELLGCGGPRQVGAVMSRSNGVLPWWRVLRADGRPPHCHGGTAWRHYCSEGTPLRGLPDDDGSGYRVAMTDARWHPGDEDWDRIDTLRNRLQNAPETVQQNKMSVPHGVVEP